MSRSARRLRPYRLGVLASSAALVLSLFGPSTGASGAATLSFAAAADAYVQSGAPTTNYGKATVLRARAPSPAYRSVLRFDVSGVAGTVIGARLRLNVSDASRDGGAVYAVDTNWVETSVTWNTAPAIPANPIATIGAAPLGWIEINLGTAISGNGPAAFAIVTPSTDSLYATSRETQTAPQLIIDVSPPGSSASPSSGTSPSPSEVPSAGPSAVSSAPPSGAPSDAPPSAAPSVAPSAAPSVPPSATRTWTPTADAQVRQTSPRTNYGNLATLRLRAGPNDEYRSYLTFVVSEVAGPVTAARLRLFVTDSSPDAGRVFAVSSTWSETGITWANAPPLPASPIAPSPGKAPAGAWIEWDLAAVVSGPGTFSFALVTTSTNSLYLSSREGSSPPQLVVSSGATTSPPTAAFSAAVTSGYAPLSVQFRDESTGAMSWAWDFQNDGVVDSTAQNPMFTFTTAGSWSVRLTVANAAGSTSQLRDGLITVSDPPPPGPITGTLVGAGDIADCLLDGGEPTARLLDGISGSVFAAGDLAYESGTSTEFATCFEPSWGRHKARMIPIAGNHEYQTAGAAGYYEYFGSAAGDPAKGYYSRDIGGWHVIVLNTNCTKIVGGCAAGGAQEQWLRADLAASAATCTIAFSHHPRFSSGVHGGAVSVQPLWTALYEAGADVVVSGHDHDYERFAPQDASGSLDPAFGIRSFVVGTGGAGLRSFVTVAQNSEVREADSLGVLKLTLHASAYDWSFVPVAGGIFTDTGTMPCHDRPAGP